MHNINYFEKCGQKEILLLSEVYEHDGKNFAVFKTHNHYYSITKHVLLDKKYNKNEVFALHDGFGGLEVVINEDTPF